MIAGRRGARLRSGRPALLAAVMLALTAGSAAGHHVGVYVPRDNEVSANFKQLKFSMQAGKFDVALKLFEDGAVRKEMRAQAARLPAGLEAATHAAIKAGDAAGAERGLMLFFVALVRDLALEGDRRIGEAAESGEARAVGQKFLEAIWRYYNLVDFAVTQRDSKAAVAIRLAFDDAEGYVKESTAGSGWRSWWWWVSDQRGTAARPARDPEKVREPLRRIARTLTGLIEAVSPSTRRDS